MGASTVHPEAFAGVPEGQVSGSDPVGTTEGLTTLDTGECSIRGAADGTRFRLQGVTIGLDRFRNSSRVGSILMTVSIDFWKPPLYCRSFIGCPFASRTGKGTV